MTQFTTNHSSLESAIHTAIAEARSTCAEAGTTSAACAVAWDIVEELQAERAHRQVILPRNAFETFCQENPNADECRIYDL